jgi:hypothetical protein
VDWLFDNDGIIAVCRAAHDGDAGGAARGNDANYLTFHRFRGFGQMNLPITKP